MIEPTADQIQLIAKRMIGRELTEDELRDVMEAIDAGFDWVVVLQTKYMQTAMDAKIVHPVDSRAAFKVAFAPEEPVRPTHCYDVQQYRREIEYTIGALEKHLELIKRWQHGDDMGQVDSETARFSLANARRHIEYANVRQDDPEQRSIKALHDMSVRRETLIKFYGRVIDYFKGDPLERLLFLQCFAALDSDEGHCLAWLYTDEFNKTLTLYQEAKDHEAQKRR